MTLDVGHDLLDIALATHGEWVRSQYDGTKPKAQRELWDKSIAARQAVVEHQRELRDRAEMADVSALDTRLDKLDDFVQRAVKMGTARFHDIEDAADTQEKFTNQAVSHFGMKITALEADSRRIEIDRQLRAEFFRRLEEERLPLIEQRIAALDEHRLPSIDQITAAVAARLTFTMRKAFQVTRHESGDAVADGAGYMLHDVL